MSTPYIIPSGKNNDGHYHVFLREDERVELGTVGQDQRGWRAFHPERIDYTFYTTRGGAAESLYDRYVLSAEPPKYPECEKLLKIAPERNVQEALLEWLAEHGYHLAQDRCPHGHLQDDMVNCEESEYCRAGTQSTSLWPSIRPFEDLLMEYHGIDMKKVEQERRAMLDAFSNNQEATK